MHERNLSLTAKGKAKESIHWQIGWWDLCHSLEGTRRPVQWSKSSVIYMAHEAEPRVLGRHFPSSRQFVLPAPLPVDSYEPPTVLSLSATDDWMFAYFPGKGGAGAGIVWQKEAQLDHWSMKELWEFPIGRGVVTAAWTCPHREWIVSDACSSSRLPAIGPLTPFGNPMLLLVIESHWLRVYHMTPGKAQLLGPVPLLQPTKQLHPDLDTSTFGQLGGDRICTKAAIGLGYQESTILIAMRSRLLPPQQPQSSTDLGLPLDVSQTQFSETSHAAEWEVWGEEQTILLCEVRIEYRGGQPPILSHALPPIYHPDSHLVDLVFHCPPPPPGGKPESKAKVRSLSLVATFYDAEDYSSLPKSEIVSYAFVATGQPSSMYWHLVGQASRPVYNKILSFVLPSKSRDGLLVGFLDAGGFLPRRKSKTKETTTGAIEVLKLSDLSTHEDWESVPIHSHVEAGTVDVPVSVALSPNDTLICCISSPFLGSHQSIQILPRRVSGDSSLALGTLQGDLSKHLVAAIHARYTPSDIVHALAAPSLPTQATVETLHKTLITMETDSYGHMEMWIVDILGVAAEVYSARTQRLERSPDRELCAARWQTVYEILSISACCGAFDMCREGDSYDLDAVWQLLGTTNWVIELVEKLFKECIFVGEGSDSSPTTAGQQESSKGAPLDNPVFLHIMHPYALGRLHTAVEHIKRFHDQVAKTSAKGENSQIAKDFLMDITEGSGIDLQLLGPLLAEIVQESKNMNKQDLQRSLATTSPVPALAPHVRKVIDKISKSKAIDRARLFIKPSDLSDGITRLTLSDPAAGAQLTAWKDKNVDVVKKIALLQRDKKTASVCVRCGGRSQVPSERKLGTEGSLSRWQTWEKSWQLRCVCGGMWSASLLS
ncbi:hypothetical protein C8Q74DRAFT_1379221 [Fomes fomentarius]|nr:hypothetical protein C8Q74DRAFT_1379221 [Fomes fomentarius]